MGRGGGTSHQPTHHARRVQHGPHGGQPVSEQSGVRGCPSGAALAVVGLGHTHAHTQRYTHTYTKHMHSHRHTHPTVTQTHIGLGPLHRCCLAAEGAVEGGARPVCCCAPTCGSKSMFHPDAFAARAASSSTLGDVSVSLHRARYASMLQLPGALCTRQGTLTPSHPRCQHTHHTHTSHTHTHTHTSCTHSDPTSTQQLHPPASSVSSALTPTAPSEAKNELQAEEVLPTSEPLSATVYPQ